MGKILGLDLGTNSIGWAVVDKENKKILDAGVRIYTEGVKKDTIGTGEGEQSKNASRREHRQARRNFFRKRLRKIKLLETLIDEGMCPLTHEELKKWKMWNKIEKSEGRRFPNSLDFKEWLKMNPYELRDKALKENIDLKEFGRILYHLIQRRGFLSSRKGKEDGKIFKGKENITGIDETAEELQNNTLGSYLYSISYKEGEKYCTRRDTDGKDIRVRARYTLREMYIKEFYEIWKRQSENLGLDKRQIRLRKIKFIEGNAQNKQNIEKINHIRKSKGKENILVENNKITIFESKSLFEFLAGKIWKDNGELKYKCNDSLLFWQRPLRSQKNLLSKCRFEKDIKSDDGKWIQKGKTPCPLSHPYFELFRAYQFVNNILYNKNIRLNDEQCERVIELINSKEKNFDFKEIPKVLDLSYERFNYEDDQKVPANPTIKQLRNLFPEDIWNEKMEEIWHCFHFYEDDEKLYEKLRKSYHLKNDNIDKIKKIRLVDGYSAVSLKAIRNILPYFQRGYKSYFAVILGGVKNAFGHRWEYFKNFHKEIETNVLNILEGKNKEGEAIQTIRNYLSDPLNKFGFSTNDVSFLKLYHHSQDIEIKEQKKQLSPIENLRNSIVQQGINELRRLVNSLLTKYRQEYGSDFNFDRINVELGRELRSNKKQRQEQTRLINKNTEKNNEARERLAEYGLKPSRENIHKYLFYKEIESKNGRAQCPYTGKTVNIYDLLGPGNKIQIEHIIPYSISLDDSMANKTLCEANFNRNKGELTPYQFYKKNPDPSLWGAESWDEIEQRTFRLLPFSKARKFTSKSEFIRDDFIDRQLNDSRYISKKAAKMLSEICKDVRVLPGQLTAEIRHLWGLNNIIQPIINFNLKDVHVEEDEMVPHQILLDNKGVPVKIYPVINQKPIPGENETIITGKIKSETFTSENLNIGLSATELKDGKYWAKLKISEPVLIQQVYADKPQADEDYIILRGRVENNFFINDTINRKIRVSNPDGTYWAKFTVVKKTFEMPEGKQKPEAAKNIVLLYGEIRNHIFKSYIYSCSTTLPDGKYWAKIEIKPDRPYLLRAINEKPPQNAEQLLITGTNDDSGVFTSDSDVYHILKTGLSPGKYWMLFDINIDDIEFYSIEIELPEKQADQEIVEGNIWVDNKTGEIRFDPKKNRDDHRHHAIDAIAIAFTETGYLQKLSFYNARRKEWERGTSEKPSLEPPWGNFDKDVKTAIEKILVSYKQNNRILNKISKGIEKDGKIYKSVGYSARGQLHRESFFGRHKGKVENVNFEPNEINKGDYSFHIRKSINNIKTHKHVKKIVDAGIRNLILNKLRTEYGIDTEKPFKIPPNFFFNENKQPALFLPNKRGEPVPVKKVRMCEVIVNAVQLKSNVNQWVNPYNNHHVLIYKDYDGKLNEEVVSFWTAVERKQQGLPVYQLPVNGKEIVEILHENDMFILGLSTDELENIDFDYPDYSYLSRYIYRVQKISSMYYTFRHHLASTIDNERDEIRIVSFNAWLKYNPIKVKYNTLGVLELLK